MLSKRRQIQKSAFYIFVTSSIKSELSTYQSIGRDWMEAWAGFSEVADVLFLDQGSECVQFVKIHLVAPMCFVLFLIEYFTPIKSSQTHMESYLMRLRELHKVMNGKHLPYIFIFFSALLVSRPTLRDHATPSGNPLREAPGRKLFLPPHSFALDQNGTHGSVVNIMITTERLPEFL